MPIKVNLPDGRVVHFPDEMSPQQIEAEVMKLSAPADAKSSGPDWNQASSLGGMVGGLGGFALGGPIGAAAGATLGGAIGAGANAVYGKEKASGVGDIGMRAAVGGGVQGLIEGATAGLGKAFRWAAPKAMEQGLRRTAADKLKFPLAPKRLVDEGILPREKGVQSALKKTEDTVQSEAAAYDAANPIARVDPDSLADEGRAFAFTAGKLGGLGNKPGPESAELDALADRYLAQNTRTRSLGETIDQKRSYQARSKYSARPNAPTVTNNELNFNEGVAGANRAAAIKINPKLEGDLSKEQDLIGALEAIQKANAKGGSSTSIGTLKSLLLLNNPTAMGLGALGADRAGRALQSPLSPAAIRSMLIAMLSAQPNE